MAISKPLSYGNWSNVMEYLDVNVRHDLSIRAPLLRNTHLSSPLKFHRLRLDASSLVLNNIEHSFYSFMENPSGTELPVEMQMLNMMGGQPFDLDQFGEKEPNGEIKPGDLNIGYTVETAAGTPTKMSRGQMVPFVKYYRRPYLSKTPHYLEESIRYSPGFKIRDLIGKLIETILTKHQTVIVKVLEVDTENCVLRWPEGCKINIEELRLGGTVTRSIEPDEPFEIMGMMRNPRRCIYDILEPASFPLKHFSFESYSNRDHVWQNKKLMASKTLSIKYYSSSNFVGILATLRNKTIEILNFCVPLTGFRALAISWIDNPREIGTKVSMASQSMFIQRVMNSLCKKSGKKVRAKMGKLYSKVCQPEFPYCYTFNVDNTSELNFYVQKSKNYEEEIGKRNGLPWFIVMESMRAGSAVLVD